MREKSVEAHLTRRVREMGGVCWKWTSPGTAGVPDRIVVLPRMGNARIGAIELKAPGKSLAPLQVARGETLRALGMRVGVADSHEQVEAFLSDLIRNG